MGPKKVSSQRAMLFAWETSRAQDAMKAIFKNLRVQTNQDGKYVLDADIAGCFDNIDHLYLLEQLETLPEIKRQVHAWLKAGVMEGFQGKKQTVVYQDRGTPQGGPLSPLLSNIALHGLENHLKTWVETQPFKHAIKVGVINAKVLP